MIAVRRLWLGVSVSPARRGLTEPRDIYPLADSLKVLVYDTN